MAEEIRTITYEDLEKANRLIKPIKITREDKKTGRLVTKNYAEVHQRIKAFRMVYPKGKILPEIISENEGIITFKVTIEDEIGNVLAIAHARENVKGSFINQSNAIENCETSAIGRALGMCGFGIDSSVASAEEIKNAMKKEEQPVDMVKLLADFEELIIATDTNREDIYKYFNISDNTQMSAKQLQEAISILKTKNKKKEEIF